MISPQHTVKNKNPRNPMDPGAPIIKKSVALHFTFVRHQMGMWVDCRTDVIYRIW